MLGLKINFDKWQERGNIPTKICAALYLCIEKLT